MTATQRLQAVLTGKRSDRVPVYTMIPFGLDGAEFIPAPFHGYEDWDDWRIHDPRYKELVERMQRECDNFFIWRPECMRSEWFFIPVEKVRVRNEQGSEGTITITQTATIGRHAYVQISTVRPGTGHTWVRKHFCDTSDDARRLLDLNIDPPSCECADFFRLRDGLGDRGLMWVTIPSPVLLVCRLFSPEDFLLSIRTEPELVEALMDLAAARIGHSLETLLEAGVGPVIRFGGAEHVTPPLAAPEDFDRLVVRYDTPLMHRCRDRGVAVAVHCHGRLRHALHRFVEMGVAQTDPVEAVPDGDLELREARRIVGSAVTLTGNIQMRELHSASPEVIADRVRRIIEDAGPLRLVVSPTGTPLEPLTPQLANNYHAMIDAVLRWGRIGGDGLPDAAAVQGK